MARGPVDSCFKPAGRPLRDLETVRLGLDELEALRLADLEGYYQEDAARQMGVSRPTFARIIAAARAKVAEALVEGKALAIEGGVVAMREEQEITESGRGRNGRGRGPMVPEGAGGRRRRMRLRRRDGSCRREVGQAGEKSEEGGS
ncbi:MAG: hypothetical protein Kow00109_14610 [Acidobacteriota bacterium]